jgi:hypothetical protein
MSGALVSARIPAAVTLLDCEQAIVPPPTNPGYTERAPFLLDPPTS